MSLFLVLALQSIQIDGLPAGAIISWEGGEVRGDAGSVKIGADPLPKKHVSNIRFTPLVVTLPLPPAKPVLDWMELMMKGKAPSKTIVLSNASGGLQAGACALTEIAFPAADISAAEPAYLKLTLQAEFTKTAAALPAPAEVPVPIKASNFKLQIDGLDGTSTSRVDGVKITCKFPESAIGAVREVQKEGTTDIPNLTISLADPAPASWTAWMDDFLLKGNNGDDKEKGGSLDFLSPNRAEVLFSLRFKNLGLLSLSRSGGKTRAELYCERVELAPRPGVVPPAQGVVLAPPPVALADGDQGARDLADFPRLEGTLRKSFASSRQRTGSIETVVYGTRETLEKIEAAYEKALKDAGWESTNRIESGAKETRILVLNWKKGNRNAQIAVSPVKDGSNEIRIALTEQR